VRAHALPLLLLPWTLCLAEPAPVDRALKLSVSLETQNPEEGGEIRVRTMFENSGDKPIQFYVTPHPNLVPFPRMVLEREDGARFEPSVPPFGSLRESGIIGRIDTLAPHGKAEFPFTLSRVLPLDPKTGQWASRNPSPLPAGRYVLRLSYEQASEEVPCEERKPAQVRLPNGRKAALPLPDPGAHTTPVEGLWTGALKAECPLQVGPRTRPFLFLKAPVPPQAGRPFLAELVVENPGPKPVSLLGTWKIFLSDGSKGGRDEVALAEIPEARQVEAGKRLDFTVDLNALEYRVDGRKISLAEFTVQSAFQVSVRLVDAEGRMLIYQDLPVGRMAP